MSDPTGMVAWLTAQIDEDEQWANEEDPGGMCDGGVHLGRDRMLREVEAKRRRLERHTPLSGGACDYCHEYGGEHVAWPCPDIRDDAAVYADRPGYDESWRP